MKIGKPTLPPDLTSSRGTPARLRDPASAKSPTLTTGQLLKAKVLRLAADGLALLEADGQSWTARSLVPLTPGQELWLQVTAPGDPPLLRQAPDQGALLEVVQKLALEPGKQQQLLTALTHLAALSDDPAVSQTFTDLAGLLPGLAIGPESDYAQLVRCCLLFFGGIPSDSGLRPDQLPRDLRQALTKFRKSHHNPSPTVRAELAQLDRLATLYELLQAANQGTSSAPLYIVPCIFQGDSGRGQWFASQEGGQTGQGELSTRLDFFLDMSALGDLHLQVRLQGKSLTGIFMLADRQAADHLAGELDGLTRTLAALGYTANLSCRHCPGTHLEKMLEMLQERLRTTPLALVDVTA